MRFSSSRRITVFYVGVLSGDSVVVEVTLFSVLPLSFMTDEAKNMSGETSHLKTFGDGVLEYPL